MEDERGLVGGRAGGAWQPTQRYTILQTLGGSPALDPGWRKRPGLAGAYQVMDSLGLGPPEIREAPTASAGTCSWGQWGTSSKIQCPIVMRV